MGVRGRKPTVVGGKNCPPALSTPHPPLSLATNTLPALMAPPCLWKSAQASIGIQIRLPISMGTSLCRLSIHPWLEKWKCRISDPGWSSWTLGCLESMFVHRMPWGWAGGRGVGGVFSLPWSFIIIIKTRIARRQWGSNRDFKKKRKGAVQSQARHSELSTGFYGNKPGFVQELPTPPPSVGPTPASQHCICVVNFSSVSFTPPAPAYAQQQHPSPQTQKEKRTHSLWAEWSHPTKVSRQLGARGLPRRDMPILLSLASFLIPSPQPPRTSIP